MRDVVVYTLLFSAMLQLLVAAYGWRRRNEPAARPLILVCLIGFIWAFTYGMEIESSDVQIKILSEQIIFTVVGFGPLALLLLAFSHLEITHLLTRWRLVILSIPSLLIIGLVWTVSYHNLFLYGFTVEKVNSLEILQKQQGVLYLPVMLILQGISIITYYHLIRSFSSTGRIKRQQSITILSAMFLLFVVNLPNILDISPIKGFDFTPHALAITSTSSNKFC